MADEHTGRWDCCFHCRTAIMREQHGDECAYCGEAAPSKGTEPQDTHADDWIAKYDSIGYHIEAAGLRVYISALRASLAAAEAERDEANEERFQVREKLKAAEARVEQMARERNDIEEQAQVAYRNFKRDMSASHAREEALAEALRMQHNAAVPWHEQIEARDAALAAASRQAPPMYLCNKCGYVGTQEKHDGCNYLAAPEVKR